MVLAPENKATFQMLPVDQNGPITASLLENINPVEPILDAVPVFLLLGQSISVQLPPSSTRQKSF